MKASAKDLRFHAKEILESVERGEKVTITYRGQPKAKIIPYIDEQVRERTSIYGMWKDHPQTKSVDEFIDNTRGSRY